MKWKEKTKEIIKIKAKEKNTISKKEEKNFFGKHSAKNHAIAK